MRKNYKDFNYYFFYNNGNIKIDFNKKHYFYRFSRKENRKIYNKFEMNKKDFKVNHLDNIYKNCLNEFYLYSDGVIINKSILNKSINKRLNKYIL